MALAQSTLRPEDDLAQGQLDVFDEDEGMEDAQEPVDAEKLKSVVLSYLVDNHAKASQSISPYHQRWDGYLARYSGQWISDTSTESPVLNEIYIPKLGELADFANACELQQMISDPQTMDFIGVTSNWPGLEDDARKGETLLRQKFRIMRTDDAAGFYRIAWGYMQDLRVLGNMLGLVSHDSFGGDVDDDDSVTEGPVAERIDPRNWYPWSLTVNSARSCAHTIYSPVTVEEASRIPYLDLDELLDKHKPYEFWRTERKDAEAAGSTDLALGPGDTGWRRYLYFGPLPWREISEKVERKDWTRDDVVAALAEIFPPLGDKTDGEWWTAEWIDDGYLISLHPYPLDLPHGCGPIIHEPFYKVNGQLVGLGFYDRLSTMERYYNELNRYMLQLSGFAANPVVLENDDLLDEDWLAEHEEHDSFLMPGERVRLRSGLAQMGVGVKPFEIMEMGVGPAMLAIQQLMDRIEQMMRINTNVTQDYSGQSGARTATQAQNNLVQSRSMETHRVKMGENGWLLDIVQRCYVVMRQVIAMRGESFSLPMSEDEKSLATYVVDPEAIRSLAYFTISVTGSTAPSNRIYQVQQLEQLLSLILPVKDQIGVNAEWFIKTILDAMGIRGKAGAFIDVDQLAVQIQNITALIGEKGVEALPQAVQQAAAQLMAQGAQQAALAAPQPGAAPAPAKQNPQAQGAKGNALGAGLGSMNLGSGMGDFAPVPGMALPPAAPGYSGIG